MANRNFWFIWIGLFLLLQVCYAGESATFYFKPSTLASDSTIQNVTFVTTVKTGNRPQNLDTTDPHYSEYTTYKGQGEQHLQNKEYDEAIFDFQKVVEINPNDALTYNNLGSAYSSKGDTTAAMEAFNKALDLDSTLASAYFNRGSLSFNDDTSSSGETKNQLALADFNQAVELDSTKFDTYYSRGLVNIQLKNYNNAIKDFTRAVELNPDNYLAYLQRGMAYSQTTEYTQALADFDKALDIKPFTSQVFLKKAEMYQAMGQKDEAIEEYRKVIFYAKTEDEDIKNAAAAMIKKLEGR